MKNPKILFLKGVFLKDYVSIEDKFEEDLLKFGEDSYTEIPFENFDKIPKYFETLDKWQKTTNLCCWECAKHFSNIPVFIPRNIISHDNIQKIEVFGNFCSFPCAMRYVKFNLRSFEYDEHHLLLIELYYIFTGKKITNMSIGENRTKMLHFGGTLSIEEFVKRNKDIEETFC